MEYKWSKPEFMWLPGQVSFNPELSRVDTLLFWLIYSLDNTNRHFFGSNKYITNVLGIPNRSARRSISKLKDMGYVKLKSKPYSKMRVLEIDKTFMVKYEYLVTGFMEEGHVSKRKTIPAKSGHSKSRRVIPAKSGHDIPAKSGLQKNKRRKKKRSNKNKEMFLLRMQWHTSVQQPYKKPKGRQVKSVGKILTYKDSSYDTKEIVDYWNDKKLGTVHFLGTKGVEKACYLLENKFLKTYSKIDILAALDSYKEVSYRKPKISLLNFFVIDKRYQKGEALFKQFVKIDRNESLTNSIMDYYIKNVLGGDGDIAVGQYSKFLKASKMLKRMMRKKVLEKYIVNADEREYVSTMFLAIARMNKKGMADIYPGNLCSDFTHNDLIPKYIKESYLTDVKETEEWIEREE